MELKKEILKKESLKVILPSMLAVLLFVIAVFGVILPSFKNSLMERKKEMISELTCTAWGVLAYFEGLEKAGILSKEQAQASAVNQIRKLHYGKEGKDYFWINDMRPYVVMHPYRKDLEERNVSDFKDPDGKRLFVSFVDIIRERGAGFVPYMWQWKDNPDRIVPKLSYVKEFKPWGWIIGTGVYLDDVGNEISLITRDLIYISLMILSSVILLSAFIVHHGFKLTIQRRLAEKELIKYRDHLEELVKERTDELTEANKHLELEITERRQAEEAVRESEERYRDLFENATDLIIQTIAYDGSFLYANRAWTKALGYSDMEMAQLNISDIVCTSERDQFMKGYRRLISGEKTGMIRTVFVSREGRSIIVEGNANCKFADGKPLSVQGFFRDITEKQKIDEERQRAEKLESIGILAGGIAHDFNNILTAVLGNISLAAIYTTPGEEIHHRLIDAEKATLRARDLTLQLLTFSKGGSPVKKIASIAELIKDSSKFALRGSNVSCRFMMQNELWPVEIDVGQIGQVIHNLVINAAQAMPNGGVIEFYAENILVEAGDNLPFQDGRYIKITIKDHGDGIPKENFQKIFDPYFTTKQKGSGLGLAVTYSIIKNHNAYITVESELRAGTSFHILLPASFKDFPEDNLDEEKPVQGHGKILFMDDEEVVRNIADAILKKLGYEVVFAEDGYKTIELYKKAMDSSEAFDAVIMDLTIPGGLGGKETIQNLRQIDPRIMAIVSSGYSNDDVMSNFREYGFNDVIAKPYKLNEISKVLHRVIKRRREKL